MNTIFSVVSPFVKSHIGHLLSYQENLKNLENKVQRLEDTKTSVEHRIDEAKEDGQNIEDSVKNWLKKVNHTVADTKKLIDTEEAPCCIGLFPNLWAKTNLSKRFEEMMREISEDLENGKFDRISYRIPSEVTTTPFSRSYEALDSRTSVLNEIKEALKDPKIYMIGVHGISGVGKTTLVKELAWQLRKDASFRVVIVDKTHTPDVNKIQSQIADVLFDGKLKKDSQRKRAEKLHKRIKQEESILIILDDIWTKLDLEKVGIPFGDDHRGCKLVMTSRNLNVFKMMETQKEFELRALQEEDSWELFKRMAGDVVEESHINPIARKVSRCCVGLPISIVTVAKGLRRKDVFAWKDALAQLERFEHKELQKERYHAIEVSYNCLENDELKSLFLLIGSFGGVEIHSGDLFSYCWGLGFYGHMQTLTEARTRNFNLINDLRASSLLLEVDTGREWVKMHDAVRDMAKSIASRFHPTYVVKINTEKIEWSNVGKCHYIIIPGSDIGELPETLECPQLKLLLLHNTGSDHLKVPDNFFSRMREVTTLDLTQMALTPSLPTSLNLLINLRSLTLCQSELGDIRIVSKLTNLEVLNLERSTIEELPEEIAHLTRLRLLNLTKCSNLRVIPTNLISSLTSLEELYLGGCNKIQWEVEGRKSGSNNPSLAELQNLHQLTTLDISIKGTSALPRDLGFLEKLERCNVLIGDMWEWSLQWSGGARETSRTLKLTNSLWTRVPLTSVEELSFAALEGVENLLYELDDGGFRNLKLLHIQDSDELLHIVNSRQMVVPHSAFPSLETLVLLRLNRMEEICHGPLLSESFKKLKVIKVEGCNKLKILFLYSHVRNFSQLSEMEISSCEDMEEIIAKEKHENEQELCEIVLPELHSLTLRELPMLQSWYMPLTGNNGNPSIQSIPQALFNQQVVMPKLKRLELNGINTCKIWDDKLPVVPCFQNLISLEVIGCDSLTSLFPFCLPRALVKLQHLRIYSCSMLKEIFVQQQEVQFPNLETLKIEDMYDLKSIWPNQVTRNSFCKLRSILVENCYSLDYVFPISLAEELRQLQDVAVSNCGIRNIVEESDSCDMTLTFANLQKLTVWYCNNMKTIVPSSVRFHCLEELDVYDCNGLGNIISPSKTTYLPKLSTLIIQGCYELEEIYGSRTKGDAPLALGQIAFTKLKKLHMRWLLRLRSFCQGSHDFKFPSLQVVHFDECPMMETFCHGNLTTPNLTKVHYGWGKAKEDHWGGDLNTTITSIFTLNNSQKEYQEEREQEEEEQQEEEQQKQEQEEQEDQDEEQGEE